MGYLNIVGTYFTYIKVCTFTCTVLERGGGSNCYIEGIVQRDVTGDGNGLERSVLINYIYNNRFASFYLILKRPSQEKQKPVSVS
jgi:hypothetical protein